MLTSEDPAAINVATETLQTALHKASEAMYEHAQQQASAAAEGGNGNGDGAAATEHDEDVVDAEVVDEPSK